MAIQQCVEKGQGKDAEIMSLIRLLYYYTNKYNIEYESCHVYSHNNGMADALSRGRTDVFHSMHPHANKRMSRPMRVKLDF